MTKSTEPSGEKPEATAPKQQDETVTVKVSDIQALLARIDALEQRARRDTEDIEITTELPAAQKLQPGQYVNIAPAGQAPDLRKVRWSRAEIERTYQPVEFIPLINITVAPHGVPWELHEGERYTVPSIVRDFHDAEVQRRRHQYDRYRPESPMEVLEAVQKSKENPGVPVWGRLHIVGHGLAMGEAAPEPAAAPAAPAKP